MQSSRGSFCRRKETEDITRILFRFPEDEIDSVTITLGDVQKCSEDIFLNDSLIDFYFKYLTFFGYNDINDNDGTQYELPKNDVDAQDLEGLTASIKRTSVFTSFFYSKMFQTLKDYSNGNDILSILDMNNEKFSRLRGRLYNEVKRWTYGVDKSIFKKTCIFFPINQSCHWSFAVCCFVHANEDIKETPPSGRIFTFDSLRGTHNSKIIAAVIRNYLNYEYETKIKRHFEHFERHSQIRVSMEEDDDDGFLPEIVQGFEKTKQIEDEELSLTVDQVIFNEQTLPDIVINVPQQTDAVNCGIHVLNNAKEFLRLYVEKYPDGIQDLDKFETTLQSTFGNLMFQSKDANNMRKTLKQQISTIEQQHKNLIEIKRRRKE